MKFNLKYKHNKTHDDFIFDYFTDIEDLRFYNLFLFVNYVNLDTI